MYGLSPDIDLTFLRGLELMKVCHRCKYSFIYANREP